MSRIFAVVAAGLLTLAGCAIQPRPAPQTAQAETEIKPLRQKKVVCVNEAPTGSHIAEKRCRAVDQIDREREATQIEMLRPREGPPPQAKGN